MTKFASGVGLHRDDESGSLLGLTHQGLVVLAFMGWRVLSSVTPSWGVEPPVTQCQGRVLWGVEEGCSWAGRCLYPAMSLPQDLWLSMYGGVESWAVGVWAWDSVTLHCTVHLSQPPIQAQNTIKSPLSTCVRR